VVRAGRGGWGWQWLGLFVFFFYFLAFFFNLFFFLFFSFPVFFFFFLWFFVRASESGRPDLAAADLHRLLGSGALAGPLRTDPSLVEKALPWQVQTTVSFLTTLTGHD
jgi:hypothetical protein